ncbi:unnamed protein product [Chrysoparadoxa australica]
MRERILARRITAATASLQSQPGGYPRASQAGAMEEKIKLLQGRVEGLIDEYPDLTGPFKRLEKDFGYSRAWFGLGTLAACTLLLWAIGGMELIVNLVGFCYPAYASFKAIDGTTKDHTQWLAYWMIFGFLLILEPVLSWVPLYSWIKLFGLVACYHPKTRGASQVYQLVRPVVVELVPGIKSAKSRATVVPEVTTKKGCTLQVTVESASGLPPVEGGTATTYCVLSVKDAASGQELGTRNKTKTRAATLDPEWGEQVVKHIDSRSSLKGYELVTTVYHKTGIGADEAIGEVKIPLASLESGWKQRIEEKLQEVKGASPTVEVSGAIALSLELAE